MEFWDGFGMVFFVVLMCFFCGFDVVLIWFWYVFFLWFWCGVDMLCFVVLWGFDVVLWGFVGFWYVFFVVLFCGFDVVLMWFCGVLWGFVNPKWGFYGLRIDPEWWVFGLLTTNQHNDCFIGWSAQNCWTILFCLHTGMPCRADEYCILVCMEYRLCVMHH